MHHLLRHAFQSKLPLCCPGNFLPFELCYMGQQSHLKESNSTQGDCAVLSPEIASMMLRFYFKSPKFHQIRLLLHLGKLSVSKL